MGLVVIDSLVSIGCEVFLFLVKDGKQVFLKFIEMELEFSEDEFEVGLVCDGVVFKLLVKFKCLFGCQEIGERFVVEMIEVMQEVGNVMEVLDGKVFKFGIEQ